MKFLPPFKIYMGLIVWGTLILLGTLSTIWLLRQYPDWGQKPFGSSTLHNWICDRGAEIKYLASPLDVEIAFNGWVGIRPGDRLYMEAPGKDPERIEIGVVHTRGFSPENDQYIIGARIYEPFILYLGSDSKFTLIYEPASPAWVVSTILPTERRKEIVEIWRRYLDLHADEIKKLLWPVLTEVAQDSYKVLQQNFVHIMDQHKERLLDKIKAVREGYVDEEINTLWQEVVWPLVLVHCEPVLNPIAREMWKKFPKFKIVLLWMYQSLPGTDNHHVRKKLEKYFKKEALPLIREHQEELEQLFVKVFQDLGKDPRVKQTFVEIFRATFQDKELLEILKTLFIEMAQKNRKSLALKLRKKWESPQFRERMLASTKSFEPYLIEMINTVLLQKNNHIRPEFAQVLRRQVLYKDRYCIQVSATQKTYSSIPKRFAGQ